MIVFFTDDAATSSTTTTTSNNNNHGSSSASSISSGVSPSWCQSSLAVDQRVADIFSGKKERIDDDDGECSSRVVGVITTSPGQFDFVVWVLFFFYRLKRIKSNGNYYNFK